MNLKKLDIPLTDSVEEACIDYEGNYWFVSSRQGILQVFENMFSNLGMYLGIEKTKSEKSEEDERSLSGQEEQ